MAWCLSPILTTSHEGVIIKMLWCHSSNISISNQTPFSHTAKPDTTWADQRRPFWHEGKEGRCPVWDCTAPVCVWFDIIIQHSSYDSGARSSSQLCPSHHEISSCDSPKCLSVSLSLPSVSLSALATSCFRVVAPPTPLVPSHTPTVSCHAMTWFAIK